jgi:signal transduction histidine kinase
MVFDNLISNSIRFGKSDVRITVSTRDNNDGTVEVSVADNGPGILDKSKPVIFERFLKGTDKRSSYGLGLHIVKLLIEAYGGRVWADDRVAGHPEEGVAIRFTLTKYVPPR